MYNIENNLATIDEDELNMDERLCLAWCRLNIGVWDDVLGDAPEDFQQLSDRIMASIEQIEGSAFVNRCWNTMALGKTDFEWLRWYAVDRHISREQLSKQSPKRFRKKRSGKRGEDRKHPFMSALLRLIPSFLRKRV